jgi:IMP dehydrogenase/GMP reductase
LIKEKLSFEKFVERSRTVHSDKYEYTTYDGIDTKTTIICKIHGGFLQTPYGHMKGQGCPLCHFEKLSTLYSKGLEKFIIEANIIHDNLYDYSKCEYKNTKIPVEIGCKIHGSFFQRPDVHLRGFKCPKCSGLQKLNTEEFIKRAKAVHNDRYDYSLVAYSNTRTKIKIICPYDEHGIFEQVPNSHLQGRGCPKCLYHGEIETGKSLEKIFPFVNITHQHIIQHNGRKLVIDYFFIYNDIHYFVEYNGIQHYQSITFNGMQKDMADKNFIKQQVRDSFLKEYCNQNSINLIEIDSRKVSIPKIELYLRSVLPISDYSNLQLERSYAFEDVAIKQKKNICSSRLDADISSEIIRGVKLEVPLIASNMSTVVNANFCVQLSKLGALGILHRADDKNNILSSIKVIARECEWVAASIGIENNQFDFARNIIDAGCNIITIDVAHGFSDTVLDLAKKIKKNFPHIKIIVGNTTNENMIYECYDFVDAIKVGIAQGLACETKNTAGCTEKQFSAVLKFKNISKKFGMPIISDGGIREPADFTKAIAAGANSVMAGSIFAACPESAAPFVYINGKEQKLYAGMASEYVQNEWKGGLKSGTCAEGGVRYLDVGLSMDKLLERYSGALRSGITYAGANSIISFQQNVEFVRLT